MEFVDKSSASRMRRSALVTLGFLVATIATPLLLIWSEHRAEQQLNRNESAAIAALKNISSAQWQLQASGIFDVDGDGAGEFGFLHELATGASFVEGEIVSGRHPNVLHASYATRARVAANGGGAVVRSGYVFQMWLPSGPVGWVVEPAAGQRSLQEVDVPRSHVEFVCFAWPLEQGRTGRRAFVMDHTGDVLAARNQSTGYSGFERAPHPARSAAREGEPVPVGDALLRPRKLAPNECALDGETWVVV